MVENTGPHSFDVTASTKLHNRELTYSGVNIVHPNLFNPPDPVIMGLLSANAPIRVTKLTTPINQYNRFAEVPVDVYTNADYDYSSPQYVLPSRYKQLDVLAYLDELLVADIAAISTTDQIKYVTRYDEEINWFKSHDKLDMLKVLVYIVDTLEKNSVPWGVGRGSSVSSYVLYLIGVHDIHPIEYDLDWREFLRDEA